MQKHVKIYMDYFGYGEQDFIPCEMGCGRCVDVIENLMGLCREEHLKAGASPEYNEQLKNIHLNILKNERTI